MLFFKKKLLKT